MDPLVVYWEEEKSCSKGKGQCYPILYSALEAQVQAAPKSESILVFLLNTPEHPLSLRRDFLKFE